MTSCDIKITNTTILTMDGEYTIHKTGSVAIVGSMIAAVGPDADAYTAAQTVDAGGKILMPGLVNGHTHVPMTLLRGLADDLRLDVWLLGYVMPVEREFVSPEFVTLGTKIAAAELIRSGCTCFADMYYFEESIAKATADAGLRAVCGQTILKFPSPDAASYEDSLALAREFIRKWKDHPLIVPAPAPHAPYTCTPEILQATADLAVEFDVPLLTHLSETLLEVENSRKERGMPVIPWVKKQRLLDAKLVAAHCVHIDEGEMRTLKNAGAGVVHNPSSNLKLASGIAPVMKMLETGLNVGLGTDGPASNNDLDMFEEMRLAAFLAKGTTGDPTALPARLAMAMATRFGAKALHLGDIAGSIEVGKRADLILVDLSPLHNQPSFERDPNVLYSRLVYASKSTDVSDVMCNGKWLMQDKRLRTLDEEELVREATDWARRIDTFLIAREESILQKLIGVGGAALGESFEVQVKARLGQDAPERVKAVLEGDALTVLRNVHYDQFDTYFVFNDPAAGRIRYRDDQFLNDKGEVTGSRARLTLTEPTREAEIGGVLLSRSRWFAPATQSLRFYREYFEPAAEIEIEKNRRRWQVVFRGVEFYVNLDQIRKPAIDGWWLEIKSRTWSRRDAEDKAALIHELLQLFGARADHTVREDYVELAVGTNGKG
ncbi:MAG TPA: amidohydrolase [Candidatus Eisenbacteria bacterium]